jgi:hypothetical protein
VNNPQNSNRIKEHQAIAVSYAHAQRDSSNTMRLLDVVEKLDEGDCMVQALTKLIVTANKAISRLRDTHYPMILSPEDRMAIKNKKVCWVCKGTNGKGKGAEGKGTKGKGKVHDLDHLWREISSGGSNFRGVAHQSFNVNVSQQYFIPVFIHNSIYDLKFILLALAHMDKGGGLLMVHG